MAETAYAVSKFLDAIDSFVPQDNRKDIEFAINVETITAHNNIEEMLNLAKIDLLSSITVGRVDFTGSLGAGRSFANSDEMLTYCSHILKRPGTRICERPWAAKFLLPRKPLLEALYPMVSWINLKPEKLSMKKMRLTRLSQDFPRA